MWSFFTDTAQRSFPSNFRLSYCVWTLPSSRVWDCRLWRRNTTRPNNRPYLSAAPQLVECLRFLKEITSRAADQQPHIYAHPLTNRLTDWLSVWAGGWNDKLPFSQRQEQQDSRPLPSPTSWLAAWLQGWMDNYECRLLPALGFYLMALECLSSNWNSIAIKQTKCGIQWYVRLII